MRAARHGHSGGPTTGPAQPTGQSSHGSALTIFANSIEHFHNALSLHDQQRFRRYESASAMMRDLEAHCKRMEGGGKLLATCRVIDRFSKLWSPFFDIIGIFVSSHPEYAAIAWGAIRLVFLLSSNYAGFFQKLADMLERMILRLPNYSEHLDLLRKNSRSQARTRLMEAFSFVYADILQFCQDACSIFTNKKGGNRHRINVVRDLFWTPFDVRFSGLLDRLRDHQELVDIELRIENQKALNVSVERIYQEITEIQIQLRSHRGSIDAALKEREGLRNRLHEIRNWIAPPDYMDEYDKAKKLRFPQTGQWLLKDSTYKAWKRLETFTSAVDGDDTDHHVNWARRTLRLQAGPGFGKTVLSTYLIEDLRIDPKDSGQGRNVVFFHFDSRKPNKEGPYFAIRALTTQLIHMNQQATEVIDAASLLMDVTGSGQPSASDEEVLEIFALLTHHLMGIIIVVDGIDECIDVKCLLTIMHDALSETSCKVLLLGRPNVMFPAVYASIQSIRPQIYSNLDDLRLYLSSEVDDLLTTVTVAGDLSVKKIAHIIADRSRSMFLFARLMVEYLNSPALSPRQRLEEINNLTLVEGLDTMYGRVTELLTKRYASEKVVVRMIFQLLAVAKRPLKVEELRTALSLKVGRTTNPDPLDSIENLEYSVVRMCGALVEITEHGTLQFIHASVKEFLAQQALENPSNFFHIDMSKAHLMTARLCLSYLVCDMPPGPLSGYPEEPMDPDILQARLPLLCYASVSWASHLAQGIANTKKSLSEVIKDFPDLAEFFSRFLLSKSRITAWIEASWTFRNVPTLRDSLHVLALLGKQENDVEGVSSDLVRICKKLELLSRDLVNLEADWRHLLSKRPNEIWGSSVSAFNKSEFWVNTACTSIVSLFHNDNIYEGKPVLRVSKTSADGQRVGLIEVLDRSPSVQISPRGLSREDAGTSDDNTVWSVRYRVSAIENAAESYVDIDVPLSHDDLRHIKPHLLQSSPSSEFQFPIAFGDDLQEIVVLHTIIRPRPASGANLGEVLRQFDCQEIDFSPAGVSKLNRPYRETEYPAWYRVWLSPTRRFLAMTKRRGKPDIVASYPWGFWSVTIWRDESQIHQGPMYRPLGEIYLNTTHLGKDGFLAFHPTLPLLVASGDVETICWNFQSRRNPYKRTIHHAPLSDIRFSPDGDYIYAQAYEMSQVCIIDMRPYIDDEEYALSYWNPKSNVARPSPPSERSSDWALFGGSGLSDFFATLAKGNAPALLQVNQFAARTSQDTVEMTAIRRFSNVGAVARMTVRPGRSHVETLAFLPNGAERLTVSLLDPFADRDPLRLVMVNEPKESYKYGHPELMMLPQVVERQRASIADYDPSRLQQRSIFAQDQISPMIGPEATQQNENTSLLQRKRKRAQLRADS